MSHPLSTRPHGRSNTTRRDDGGFQIIARPSGDGSLNRRPLGRNPERFTCSRPVMRQVCVQPYPTIPRLIVACNRVPDWRQVPADGVH
jgi:hypothetical protein